MAIEVLLRDAHGCAGYARITNLGQVVVAPIEYDLVVFKELAEPDTAYNFYPPKVHKRFILTGIHAVADKQVSSVASADVVVYEAINDSTTSVSKVLFQTAMVQDQIQTLLPMNIKVSEGVFINGKTTDDDIHITLMGYYVDVATRTIAGS